MSTTRPRIVVLGGLAIDIRMEVVSLPTWSESVQASSYALTPGGKGLNQAIAAARLGADVTMLGAIGSDTFSQLLLHALEAEGVSTDFIRRVEGTPSGACAVFVNYLAEAAFVGWKNDQVIGPRPCDIDAALPAIEAADAMLVTLEAPLATIEHAVSIARQHDIRIILNPAPPLDAPQRISHVLLQKFDAVIPNAWEARRLLGLRADSQQPAATPQSMAIRLGRMMRPAGVACVTTGSLGCVVFSSGRVREYPGYPSNPTDTTGGSDAFCAAYAMAIVSGKPLDEAMLQANAAGAIVVGGPGGSESMPTAADLRSFVEVGRRGNAVPQ